MSLKPSFHSGIKAQKDGDNVQALIQGVSGVEEGTCQDRDEVRGGGHHNIQVDVRRDSALVKGDDGNWGRGLELATEVSRQHEDVSILRGAISIKEKKSQAAIEQAARDETAGEELPPDRKVISAKAILQQHIDMDSQDWSVLLPVELVLMLFKFLEPGDVLAASQTCQLWREYGENDKLWEHICTEAGIAFNLTPANLSALKRRNKNSSIAYSAWKENFLKPYKIVEKFRQELPEVLTVEVSGNPYLKKFFSDKIVTGCNNEFYNKLFIFCAKSGKLLHKLVGHNSYIKVVECDQQFIVSGSYDRSVKVWDVDSGSCLHTLRGHSASVTCLKIHGNIVVSGSYDTTVKMWDMRKGRCLRTIGGHTRGVEHVEFDGRLLVSDTKWFQYIINVWDPKTGVCIRRLDQGTWFESFKLNAGHLLVMHPSGPIKVWEVDTGLFRHTLVENNRFGCCMDLQGDMLVKRCADLTTAKIWSVTTGACLHMLDGPQKHSRNIRDIGINSKFVVTSSEDGKVKLWNVKTGEFIRNLFELESGGMVVSMQMKGAKIVCEVHRNRNELPELLVLNFDTNDADYEVRQEETKDRSSENSDTSTKGRFENKLRGRIRRDIKIKAENEPDATDMHESGTSPATKGTRGSRELRPKKKKADAPSTPCGYNRMTLRRKVKKNSNSTENEAMNLLHEDIASHSEDQKKDDGQDAPMDEQTYAKESSSRKTLPSSNVYASRKSNKQKNRENEKYEGGKTSQNMHGRCDKANTQDDLQHKDEDDLYRGEEYENIKTTKKCYRMRSVPKGPSEFVTDEEDVQDLERQDPGSNSDEEGVQDLERGDQKLKFVD